MYILDPASMTAIILLAKFVKIITIFIKPVRPKDSLHMSAAFFSARGKVIARQKRSAFHHFSFSSFHPVFRSLTTIFPLF